MRRLAPAKLNLFLHITGIRADGYHTLESVVCFTSLSDTLDFAPADTLSLTVTGPFASLVSTEDNLVLRAARALSSTHGAAITLGKHIPVGAGLGGGSSDAATTLLALNTLWGCNLPLDALETIAQTLGSDVPACLRHTPQRMEGTGHILTPTTLQKGLAAVLVYPHAPLSTQAVYARCSPLLKGEATASALDCLTHTRNDLEPAAFQLMPQLQTLLHAIQSTNPLLARMSGSGSTCFGLYENAAIATKAETHLKSQLPDFFVKVAELL